MSSPPTFAGAPSEAQRDFVAAVTSDDVEALATSFADDLVFEDWMAPGHTYRGVDSFFGDFNAKIAASFPDVRFPVYEALPAGDHLLLRGHFEATFTGEPYFGFAPHGRPVRWEFRDVYRFNPDGKVDRVWFANDTLVVARELGAELPAGLWT